MGHVKTEANACDKCGHVWLSESPKRCAKCKSTAWDSGDVVVKPVATHNFKELRDKMPPESRARSQQKAEQLIREVSAGVSACPHRFASVCPDCQKEGF